jgi:predicted enzyme related to lactoylglutathione lyase
LLHVEDIHEVWKEWKAKGVEILTDVNDMGAGLIFYAKDPDGHSLCITQLYPQVETMRDQLGITA